ncbi:MAG: hypothetical protein LH650_08495 [Chloroflexi bacterium]|nr:hypothetical protein [Chloroflexota bacterium]
MQRRRVLLMLGFLVAVVVAGGGGVRDPWAQTGERQVARSEAANPPTRITAMSPRMRME